MDEETNPQRGYVICLRLQDESKVDPSVRLPLHHANMSWGMVKVFESVSLDSMLQTIEKERDKRKKRKRDKEKEEGGNASTCCGVSVSLPNSCVCVCVWVLSRVWLFATPWTVAHQTPVHGSLQARDTGVGCRFLLRGIFLTQGSNPRLLESPTLQADSLPLSHQGSPDSYIEILMLSAMILGGRPFGKCLGDEGGPPLKGIAMLCYAKSLQSCPTLCDPIDGSPPGCPVPGILQAGALEWVALSFSNAWKWKVKVKSPSRVRHLATPWTAAHQAPPSMRFLARV